MLLPIAATLVLSMACQSPAADRSVAEDLARSGRSSDALDLFEQIVARDPADVEARLWIGRLQLRLGRTDEAEAVFRAVLLEHPADIDSRIGLGMTLTRKGAWSEALVVLREAEQHAGENADLFGALARAHRRAGDDRLALDYYSRARALAPDDPDLADGFESLVEAYGHSIALEGFGEGQAGDARSGSLAATVRVLPRLRIEGSARVQRRDGSTDALGGGGVVWRVNRSTRLGVRVVGGPDNTSLPSTDATAAVVYYAGAIELGSSVRTLSFADAGVIAASPLLALETGGRWRLDARYTYSRSSFDATGESAGDHSVLLRETWRGWRRIALNVTYAYGIESFENLTAERLEALGTTTVAAGLRIRVPSHASVTATWEHQWRSNDAKVDRLTMSIVRSFR